MSKLKPTKDDIIDNAIMNIDNGKDFCEQILNLYDSAFDMGMESVTPQWQPIETAPRDGTHILGYWKTMRITDYPAVLYKDDCFLNPNAFSFVGKVELEEVFPTRWMPVPTPPKEQP